MVMENNCVVTRRFNGLICLSNPIYNLYMERPDPTVVKDLDADAEKWGHLLDCLFRYMDGDISLLEVAEYHNIAFDRLHNYILRFKSKNLISISRKELTLHVANWFSNDEL